mmetsp:Transcript_50773/g.157160  ORF Transcript_50773/g.157160 Transcript_50773/m.157160 type:complete len:84 (-) Transcript_50773:665-916(-)
MPQTAWQLEPRACPAPALAPGPGSCSRSHPGRPASRVDDLCRLAALAPVEAALAESSAIAIDVPNGLSLGFSPDRYSMTVDLW